MALGENLFFFNRLFLSKSTYLNYLSPEIYFIMLAGFHPCRLLEDRIPQRRNHIQPLSSTLMNFNWELMS